VKIRPHRVFASERALLDAERLLPGTCLELAVERAICGGRKRRQAKAGMPVRTLGHGERFVLVDSRVGAIAKRATSPLTAEPCWRITSVFALESQELHG